MVYQLLKDIEQLLGGKESLTAGEQSILERSSQALATLRNSEDTCSNAATSLVAWLV